MAVISIPNVCIKGVSACVPPMIDRNRDSELHSPEEIEKLIASIGVEEKRIATADVCTSDLCYEAADRLIEDLGWSRKEIDALVFVSQTPDYILPATSCILQERLKLSKECFTLDISLGCSGWCYGLNTLAALVSTGGVKKALLLVGDTTSKTTYREDKSSWPLFGDAGTATALEFEPEAEGMVFYACSDGSGADAIIIKDGGYRNFFTEESLKVFDKPEGGKITPLHCKLDGMDVFAFAITKVPKSIKKLIEQVGKEKDDIDYYLFHQANLYLNETIRTKLKLAENKVPYNLEKFGNTSCASIPLLMVTSIADELRTKKLSLVACGFGVGLSWNTVYFTTENIVVPKLIEYGSDK